MFHGADIAATLTRLGITDVVWLPDSALGPWEVDLEQSSSFKLRRVCREGEAWTLAAGLMLGGRRPLVMIQSTGLFESGDAMRNVLFDLKLPLYALIGYRSYLVEQSPDTAKKFLEPILRAWGIDYLIIEQPGDLARWEAHAMQCQRDGRPGAALLAEGRM